jgi:hypothetical protein
MTLMATATRGRQDTYKATHNPETTSGPAPRTKRARAGGLVTDDPRTPRTR